jgi:DNA-binding CsgD family transcriptional regulator/PAS domain-containing protein
MIATGANQGGWSAAERSMRSDDLSDLIGLVYDTALDLHAWPVVLNRLADLFRANGAVIGSHNSTTSATAVIAPRTDPEYLHSFAQYWSKQNNFFKLGGQHPIGAVMMPETFMSQEEYVRTDFFNEWRKPQGVEAFVATNLLVERPMCTAFAVYRPYAKGDFNKTETRLFARLIPHLQRAVQLQLRLADLDGQPEGSAEILNRLLQGVLLVDAKGRVLFANRTAERMLRAGAGLFLGRNGLRAEIPDETLRLRKTIANCAEPRDVLGGAGGRLRLSRRDRAPLTVLIVPHRSQLAWIDIARPRAILFITDPEEAAPIGCRSLCDDFGLTPAEAKLAREILKGDGLRGVSDRLSISLATAHTQLARVFDKTGTRHQAELVRVILQSQPAVRED